MKGTRKSRFGGVVHQYDPDQVYPGRTRTLLISANRFLVFDFAGEVYWDYEDREASGIHDFEVLEDTSILYIKTGGRPTIPAYPDQTRYVGPGQGDT